MRFDFEVPERCRDCTFVQFCQNAQSEIINKAAAINNRVVTKKDEFVGLLDSLAGQAVGDDYRAEIAQNDAAYAAEATVLIQERLEEVVGACTKGPQRRYRVFGAQLCQSTKILESKGLNTLYPWLLLDNTK